MNNDFDFEKKMSVIRKKVEKLLSGAISCHDMGHTLRVMRNATMLCDAIPDADRRVVRCAALLHDIARSEEFANRGNCCHAEMGAEIAGRMLAEENFPADFAAAVTEAVRTHRFRSGSKPQTLEGKIVFDADKLDSLGAAGVGRSFLFAGRIGAGLHNEKATALAAKEYSSEDTAYREYLVKLSKLPEMMTTEPGREAARERGEFMADFFAELNRETGLNMAEEVAR